MCLYGHIRKNKKYESTKKNGGVIPAVSDIRAMAVPIGCGRCMECRKQIGREWHVRLLEEIKDHNNGIFITLTFSNESILELYKEVMKEELKIQKLDKRTKTKLSRRTKTVTIRKELRGYEKDNAIATLALRRFNERWRKTYGKALRHWVVTELGHQGTENIHMHGIVWTNETATAITKHWKYGYTWIGNELSDGTIGNYVNGRTVSYITKYVQKIDFDHKEYKSKILCSSGIGEGYLKRTDWIRNKYNGDKTIETYRTSNGYEIGLPKYYRNKIYSEEEREKLWMMKLDKNERWVGGEKVKIEESEEEYYGLVEWYRALNERLGYQTGTIDWNRKRYEEQRREMMLQRRIEPTAQQSGHASLRAGEEVYTELSWLEKIWK